MLILKIKQIEHQQQSSLSLIHSIQKNSDTISGSADFLKVSPLSNRPNEQQVSPFFPKSPDDYNPQDRNFIRFIKIDMPPSLPRFIKIGMLSPDFILAETT